ncbi:GNAT family N-acetyltransferase [Pseudoalteromonas fenneropenaei]|uniref:GNAT family N-acetyltransferase n=1 Tax=Pseudoalteromonas fenneropenaei TaxID=1737459 RepID=A0ABV7CGH2_9GAMM
MNAELQPEYLIRYVSPEDTNVAASLLYQAYHDDPILRNVLGDKDEQKFEAKLRALIREELSSFGQGQQPMIGLYEDDRLRAIACLIEADSELQAARYWHWRLRLMMSAGYLQTQALIDKEQAIRDALAQKGHYFFLAFIAVDPHVHGQGFGRTLMRGLEEMIADVPAASGIGVFITNPDHQAFFHHLGYEVFQTLAFNKIRGELMFKATDKSETAL